MSRTRSYAEEDIHNQNKNDQMLACHPGGVGMSPEEPDVGMSSGQQRWDVAWAAKPDVGMSSAALESRLGMIGSEPNVGMSLGRRWYVA